LKAKDDVIGKMTPEGDQSTFTMLTLLEGDQLSESLKTAAMI